MKFSIDKLATKRKRTTAPLAVFSSGNDVSDSESTRCSARFSSEAAKVKGNTLASGGDFSGALTAFDTSIRLLQAEPIEESSAEPRAQREAVLHELRAQVLMALERDWDAICAVKRATEMHPAWPDAWVTQGRAQMNMGEPALAKVSFATALERDDGHIEATAELARATQVHAAMIETGDDPRIAALAAARSSEAAREARARAQGELNS